MTESILKFFAVTSLWAWILFFFVLPLCTMLGLSFLTANPLTLYSLPLTLSNYAQLFNGDFFRVFLRSVNLAGVCSVICIAIAYPFSYLISLKKHRNLWLALILISFWTSSLVRTFSLINLLKTKGLINILLLKLHIISAPLTMLYTPMATVIGLCFVLLPFTIIPIYSGFSRFEWCYVDAARDLNASGLTLFKTIILPLSLPYVLNAWVFTFFPAMTLFYISNILGGAKSLLLGNYIENQFLWLRDWPQGAATSFILILMMLLMAVAYQWLRRRR